MVVMLTSGLAPDTQAANPGYDRPGLGFSPAVLPIGDVTWEQGLPDWSETDGTSIYTADSVLRIGVGGAFELQLGTSYDRLLASVGSASGRGSSSLGVKFALPASGDLGWGLLGTVTFTDGARAFRANDPQYQVGAVVNLAVNPRDTVGAYFEVDRTGGNTGGLVALNASRALSDKFDAYVEVAWQRVADAGNGNMAGAGVAWLVTPRVQLDGSFRHRIDGAADTWQAGLGVSVWFGTR